MGLLRFVAFIVVNTRLISLLVLTAASFSRPGDLFAEPVARLKSVDPATVTSTVSSSEKYGPAAALAFARGYRGEKEDPGVQYCYPEAKGIPFVDTANIISMTATLWKPEQIAADFRQRMGALPASERKKGILVLLKTERCSTKAFRACTVTTAALEKRATPLAAEFLIYGVWLKPRDKDDPPGHLKIETGNDEWKNDAAGEYHFKQGPGATLAFLNPATGAILERTDALQLELYEKAFVKNQGETPLLHAKLQQVLTQLARSNS